MAAKGAAKTKAQELQRIRENQQRSRNRKRAYVSQLEDELRRLKEELRQREPRRHEPSDAAPNHSDDLAAENDARKQLLKTLGIDEAAQHQFLQAFAKRAVARQVVPDVTSAKSSAASCILASNSEVSAAVAGSPDGSVKADTEIQHDAALIQPLSYASPDCTGQHLLQSGTVALNSPSQLESSPNSIRTSTLIEQEALVPCAVQSSGSQTTQEADFGTMLDLTPEQSALIAPCLGKSSLQADRPCSESMTGCSIAFSMLLSHNSRGYTFADIDARLQAAYRQDNSVVEGCSVLNKVFFQLLSEMS